MCSKDFPKARYDMGYTICIDCSTEEKVSCHTIYPHKTGGYIQVVSKEQSENLNRLDRRGYRGSSAYRMPKDTIKKVSDLDVNHPARLYCVKREIPKKHLDKSDFPL